ncbi:SpoIIIAH-like family protein [Oscillospiraceae bacterium 21-37]|jgi:stage III sporulation protein AH|uniref:SpoIIIAH-like family protein n=1 Tax=Eubacteriales TaxID=186802 RepID=UPI00136C576B|nr:MULTISPECIES: SpoIIIAH-like family protein [unclassified Neglectibacter]MCI8395677.1 SpoIIIAH-like family protein [Acutalibacter sp.]MCI8921657.1 SpoIIIAH-like family protein [Acutalibacter sp.]MCI9115214.1 SpoIIIAH-like family protein [Acutalibacter sp.]NBI18121.1 SpoIIIAH-like family protein [Neglectibacter sp. 59]NBJ73798.1 SpoIIIAH-like family protein [Neglectibacter sp. X4]
MKFGRKQLVLASLVLALGAAVYLNWQFAGTNKLPIGDGEDTSSQLGAAQLVNNAYVETVTDDLQAKAGTDMFAEARLSRQNSRDEALELLDGVLEDVDADSEAKKAAVEEASAMAQNILKETNVESLLKAKGYEESVAYITTEECSVVVAGDLQDSDMLIVQEIVIEQTGLTAEKIKIIGTK